MSKDVWFYDTCSQCGFPFAFCDAHFFGAVQHYDTDCPKCGQHEEVNVVRKTSIKQLDPNPEAAPGAETAWGTFACGCGATGVIKRDSPGAGQRRLTTYCESCETWSRWYEDRDSGTLR